MMKNYILFLIFFLFAGIAGTFAQVSSDESVDKKVVAVDNFILNDAVRMYPNPAQNTLTVKSNFRITGVKVYSLLGELVIDVRGNFSRIDLRELNSGIYMVKIYSDQYSVTKKLIKK
jgi:hypothetical protein